MSTSDILKILGALGGSMETNIVIMLKDKKTGFLEKELASLTIDRNEEFIVNSFAKYDETKFLKLYLRISTAMDVEDWQYTAIFDYYDIEIFGDNIENIVEIEDDYNPTWELVFNYEENTADMEEKIIKVLELHKNELNEVFEIIKDKKEEYVDDE